MTEEKTEIQKSEKQETENVLPDELSEVLEDMPPDVRKHVEKMMISSTFQMGGIISPENAITKKITEEHITEYLEGSKQQMKEEYKEKHESKIFRVVVLVLILIFVIVVIILLKDMPEIMEKVLYTLVGLLGGALGGYGYGKSKSDDD